MQEDYNIETRKVVSVSIKDALGALELLLDFTLHPDMHQRDVVIAHAEDVLSRAQPPSSPTHGPIE